MKTRTEQTLETKYAPDSGHCSALLGYRYCIMFVKLSACREFQFCSLNCVCIDTHLVIAKGIYLYTSDLKKATCIWSEEV
jgi:hypothetical protein